MSRFRLAAALVVVSGLVFAAVGSAAPGGPPKLPREWSHAEINVTPSGAPPHTLIYDRGRVTAVSASSLTLKERDGSVVAIDVAPDAIVRLNGRKASLADVRVGHTALTLRINGGAATRVEAAGRVARSQPAKPAESQKGAAAAKKAAAKKAAKARAARGR